MCTIKIRITIALISLLRQEQPDLAVFAEMNDDWSSALDQLKDILPYSLSYAQESVSYGVALYSKLPLENPVFQEFGVTGRPSIVAHCHRGRVKKSKIIGTHILSRPSISLRIQRRNQQLSRNQSLSATK
jgi:endonuclease/exonuclease/phosphatase (EEP) superfamily protein YafD